MNEFASFPTIKAAREAGFSPRKMDEYGGEQIEVKGHTLVRNPVRALSKTQWSSSGYKVKLGEVPHAWLQWQRRRYPIYRSDQVVPKRKVNSPPASTISILAALWTLNRRAKRLREQAQKYYRHKLHRFAQHWSGEKHRLYNLKSQALHHLLAEGVLCIAGYHVFSGELWAQVLKGSGYIFHQPCRPPQDVGEVQQMHQIEAKPKGAAEPRIKDALHTVEGYLSGKPRVRVFQWPPKPKKGHGFIMRLSPPREEDQDEYDEDD